MMECAMPSLDFPNDFHRAHIATNGTTIHVRFGGGGSPVVLLHGYGETGDTPMAADLMKDHTIVVPDLRGLGLSAKPSGGFDKKTQAEDLVGVLDSLQIDKIDLVTHDIGNMVGFAFAAQHPERVTSFMPIDAPIPGVGPWEEILKNPLLWHFRFGGPDMERLVAGRERIYLDRFWNEFSADPRRPRPDIGSKEIVATGQCDANTGGKSRCLRHLRDPLPTLLTSCSRAFPSGPARH
jgi:pimeloyl-ACP methyl ester carboxylesterase